MENPLLAKDHLTRCKNDLGRTADAAVARWVVVADNMQRSFGDERLVASG